MAKYKQQLKEVSDPIQFTGMPSDWLEISAYGLSDGDRLCSRCGQVLSLHGVVNRDGGWGTICPGTWRVVRGDGTVEEMTDAKFQSQYEVS